MAYTLQITGSSNHQFVMDQGRVTAFSVDVSAQSCSGDTWENDSDAVWTVALGSGQTVQAAGGRFSFRGQAPAAYYPPGSGTADYTVSGTVGGGPVGHRAVQGTISFSNGSAPSVTGCSGTFRFLAIPTPTGSATVGLPGSADYTGQFLSFNYRHHMVKNLVVQAGFECGNGPDPSVDSAEIDAAAYGFRQIRVHAGRFSLRTYVLDEYQDIVSLTLTGRIHSQTASGRIKIGEPPSLVGVANSPCSGDSTWTASRPAPPAPAANFSWEAVRVPAGGAYHYYFYISNLTCQNGATAVNLVVDGRRMRVLCSAGQGWASHPVAPGRSYEVSAQAVKMRHGRVVAHGVRVRSTEVMPAADAAWQPITGLPGTPPS